MLFGRTTSALALSALLTQSSRAETSLEQLINTPLEPPPLSLNLRDYTLPSTRIVQVDDRTTPPLLSTDQRAAISTQQSSSNNQRDLRAIKEVTIDASPQRSLIQKTGDFCGSVWNNFKDFISLTANLIQNVDGLFLLAASFYFGQKIYKSLVGFDETTIKSSTTFDYLGFFPRESCQKVDRMDDVWKIEFQEHTVRACFRQATEAQPFVCIPNAAAWRTLHDFYSGERNDAVNRAVVLNQEHRLKRVSHFLAISYGNFETHQARIEDLSAPKLIQILRDPVGEFEKATVSSRDSEIMRQLAQIEFASMICWKAPNLVMDALIEPGLSHDAIRSAPGNTLVQKKNNLEGDLKAAHHDEHQKLIAVGRNLAVLRLLNRADSISFLNSISEGSDKGNSRIPPLTEEQQQEIAASYKQQEAFVPWPHRTVDLMKKLPFIKHRFPHEKFVQNVGRSEADGWFVRVYGYYEDGCER